jgi:ferredoxin
MRRVTVSFADPRYAPLVLDAHTSLASALDILNSPVLFGCRTGICGTCAISVEPQGDGVLAPPAADEREVLEIVARGDASARLACQLDLTCDVRIQRRA